MTLANLFGGVDALALEVGRHPDIGNEDVGLGVLDTGDQLIEVSGDAHDLEILFGRYEGLHTLADQQAVIGQEHADLRHVED